MAEHTKAPSAMEMLDSLRQRVGRCEADIDKLKRLEMQVAEIKNKPLYNLEMIPRVVGENLDMLRECLGVLRLCADGVMNPAMGEGRVTTMKLVRKLEAAVFPAQCGILAKEGA